MQQLEIRIRRSSLIARPDTFRQYLEYIEMISDQEQMYNYMEENKIGIYQPEYWMSRLNLYKNRAEYTKILEILKKIRNDCTYSINLKKHPKFWLIQQFEQELEKQLEKMLRRKIKGRRSAREYEILSLTKVQRQTHRIGGIQIYVDPDCRSHYRLEDLVEFINHRFKQQCQLIRNCYERQKSDLPLSFIGRSKQNIFKLSQQLICPRKSQQQKRLSYRKSLACRKSIKNNENIDKNSQVLLTPDFKKKSLRNSVSLRKIQSCQILKQIIHRNKKSNQLLSTPGKSKKQNPQEQLQHELQSIQWENISTCSLKREKIRGRSNHSKQFNNSKQLSFQDERSFDNNEGISDFQPNITFNKSTQLYEDPNNDGFFQDLGQLKQRNRKQSQTQTNIVLQNQLKQTIRQIQLQRVESQQQTYSQIDSNKQNNFNQFEDEISVNYFDIQHNIKREAEKNLLHIKQDKNFKDQKDKSKKQRNILQTIFKKKGGINSQPDYSISSNDQQQSCIKIYQELLQCLTDKNHSEDDSLKLSVDRQDFQQQKEKVKQKSKSYPEQEHQNRSGYIQITNKEQHRVSQTGKKVTNRFSRISQEKSYSYSDTRHKHHRYD